VRVAVFSKDQQAAQQLLEYVRFGVAKLPGEWNIKVRADLAGGDSSRSLRFSCGFFDPEDVQTVVSYASSDHASIDTSNAHCHVDELAYVEHPAALFSSVASTVPSGGTLHIVSRGNGPGWFSDLYRAAEEGQAGRLRTLFCPWTDRPDRDERWFAEKEGEHLDRVRYFAPATVEDALAGGDSHSFCESTWWDALREPLPRLKPGDSTPLVIGLDAGIVDDCFAIVAVSRHPAENRHDHVAVRLVRLYRPTPGRPVDLVKVERELRVICEGGCVEGHPRSQPEGDCFACRSGRTEPGFNVVQVCYDPFQLESMMQRLRADGIAWCSPFSQGNDRLVADRALHDAIVERRLAHDGDEQLREHVLNAGYRSTDDSKMRLAKITQMRKIDLAVALSMAAHECRRLVL
jgi:phage terminase large subunit-like protein